MAMPDQAPIEAGKTVPVVPKPTSGGKEPTEVIKPTGRVDPASVGKEADEVITPSGDVAVRPTLEPLQWVATILTCGVFLLLAAVVVVGVVDWVKNTPVTQEVTAPAFEPIQATPGAVATSIAHYRDLTQAASADYKARVDAYTDGKNKLLDSTAQKIIVPIFTLLLGYLFGVRSSRGNQGNSG